MTLNMCPLFNLPNMAATNSPYILYIYPIFDVESIGDVPRVPRTHLEVVFARTLHVTVPTLYRKYTDIDAKRVKHRVALCQ